MSRNVPLDPPRILLFHKPYGVLAQFTDGNGRPTLADYVREPGLYAAGRLDADSEGLLVLTSTAWVKARLMDPAQETPKTYWAQVEIAPGVDVEAALEALREGVELADGPDAPGARAPDRPGGDRRQARGARPEGTAPPRSADPSAPRARDHVDRADDHRGAQPPGAPHGRRGGPADAAPGARRRRAVAPGRARLGRGPSRRGHPAPRCFAAHGAADRRIQPPCPRSSRRSRSATSPSAIASSSRRCACTRARTGCRRLAPRAPGQPRRRRREPGHGRGDGGRARGSHLPRRQRPVVGRARRGVRAHRGVHPRAGCGRRDPARARGTQGVDARAVGPRGPGRADRAGRARRLADRRAERARVSRRRSRAPRAHRIRARRRRRHVRARRALRARRRLPRDRAPHGARLPAARVPLAAVEPARRRVRRRLRRPHATAAARHRGGARGVARGVAAVRAHLGDRLGRRRLDDRRLGRVLAPAQGASASTWSTARAAASCRGRRSRPGPATRSRSRAPCARAPASRPARWA